jgi:hypothetical protein
MKLAAALLLVAAGCGGAQAADSRSAQATTPVCETLLDAGTVCDPCPGSPRSVQTDTTFGQFRECDCPKRDRSVYPKTTPDGGLYFGPPLSFWWAACTHTITESPDGSLTTAPDQSPTCAAMLAHYQSTCLATPLY